MRQESSRTHDVFLSYSSKDKSWADAACSVLERHRIRCWIAPRDIIPGEEWGAAIIRGLNGSRIMVLIFSGHANDSGQVRREVERAISQGMTVLPVRVEDVRPEGAMEYALGNTHWLDAFAPPVERQLEKLARSVQALLGHDVAPPAAPAAARAAAVARPRSAAGSRPPGDEPAKTTADPGTEPAVAIEARRPRSPWPIAVAVLIVGLVVLGVAMFAIRNRSGETTVAADADADGSDRRVPVASPGVTPLFNGKDLAGWKTHPSQPGHWRVEDGILIGSVRSTRTTGPEDSYLYTERGDYRDFRLLVEARINGGGNGGVLFRAPFGPDRPADRPRLVSGYEAQINATHGDPNRTGSLYVAPVGAVVHVTETLVPYGQWFLLEVVARGDHIVIRVNGKTTADYTDEQRRYSSGHIALQQMAPSTVVGFRKIEIEELTRTEPGSKANEIADAAGSRRPDAGGTSGGAGDGFVPLFNGKDLTGWMFDGGEASSWRAQNGAIITHGTGSRSRNYLLTERDYSDFTLRLEFQLEKGSGSGVCVRAVPGERMPMTKGTPIFDHPLFKLIESPGREETGTMHWVREGMNVKPDRPAELNPTGSWNHLEIEVMGRRIWASVNGKPVLNATQGGPIARGPNPGFPALRRARGRIGLQSHTGTVRFRNIEIKERSGSAN